MRKGSPKAITEPNHPVQMLQYAPPKPGKAPSIARRLVWTCIGGMALLLVAIEILFTRSLDGFSLCGGIIVLIALLAVAVEFLECRE